VNRQYGVGDSKYVVTCDPLPTLCHVTRRMRIAPKTLYNGRLISKQRLVVTEAPESCKVNTQYGFGDSKYVVICEPRPCVT